MGSEALPSAAAVVAAVVAVVAVVADEDEDGAWVDDDDDDTATVDEDEEEEEEEGAAVASTLEPCASLSQTGPAPFTCGCPSLPDCGTTFLMVTKSKGDCSCSISPGMRPACTTRT